jgi:hypothetical protein
MNDVDRILYLVDEINILKTQIRAHDTGSIRTAITVLEQRVDEVRDNLFAATAAFKKEV